MAAVSHDAMRPSEFPAPGVGVGKDWHAWHAPYAEADSPLSRRLRLVQRHLTRWLDERPDQQLTVVSACAGQGNDLLDVLTGRPDAGRVRAHLIENDPRNVAAAQARIEAAGLTGVEIRCADAGHLAAYAGTVPADLVLLAGVLGNISETDVRTTIAALPTLCAADATVIWTRTRRAPDLTGRVRQWLAAADFAEVAFHAPDDVLFSVGVHRFTGQPQSPPDSGRLFTFLR
jgi:hypothetical protein